MEQDLVILQSISETLKAEPEASQRQLAKNASVSIGLMNAVLRRFVERGWVMLNHVNGRKLAYAITPQGINELYNRGKAFTVRTFSLANEYNQVIFNLVKTAKAEGKHTVNLYGNSSLKFLMVYVCNQLCMEFKESNSESPVLNTELSLAGELVCDEHLDVLVKSGCISLIDLMQQN